MALAALLVLGPLLVPGYVLTYDMVFVPRPALSRELLGLGTSVARAVPSDLAVALAGRLLPVDLVQKLVLLATLVGAGLGAARLAPTRLPAGCAAAGVLYVWNAFVYERLLMGHWALLVSYAALPWVVLTAAACRRPGRSRRALRRLAAALAVAAFSPPGGVIAAGLALLVAGFPARPPGGRAGDRPAAAPAPAGSIAGPPRAASGRRLLAIAGLALVLNAPWLVPSVLHPGGVPVRPVGVAAFASRPDGPLGTVGSLATLGGIWNADVVPPGRDSPLWLPAFALVATLAVVGWRRLAAGPLDRGAVRGLLAAAAVGFLLAAAGAVPGLRQGVQLLVEHVPGGGLLRDAQKFVAPLAVALAAGFGGGVEWLAGLLATPARRKLAAGLLVATPLLLLPPLAWGAWGRLGAARYPASWAEARALVAADREPGALLVLPWHLYTAFSWNRDRVVLQPAQRYFPRRVVTNDDLELRDRTVPGEDPFSPRLAPLVHGSGPLAPGLTAAGVRWVLLEKTGAWSAYPPRLAGAELVLDRPDLALYRGAPASEPALPIAPAAPVLAADAVTVALLVWIAGGPVAFVRRRLIESGGPQGGSSR
ncbi:MAG TPA: hypothetical protein VF486_28500 [Actinomycetes bacterium]